MIKEININLIQETKDWLGEDGVAFFQQLKKEHGIVDPVLKMDGMPHPVHLREGIRVRNFMRSTSYCQNWNSIDFDDNWCSLIEKCIEN